MAALLCAALAGLGLARGAAAQQPQTGSPPTPTPYQSPLFHSGGSDPATALPAPFGLADPFLLNPLYNQLQGTPTELIPGPGPNPTTFFPVQIPSFDLGNYSPAQPPDVPSATSYYPNHLADGSVFSWQAPFNYLALSNGMVQVDDTAAAPVPAAGTTPATSGFVFTPNWQQQTTGPAAGTATGGEYLRLPPNTDGAATWTLVATTPGSFSVYFHIPDQVEDANGVVEARSTQVTYQIAVSGANAMNTTATVSQTEANSLQFLAGPFLLAIGDTVTVTLQRDNTHNQNTNAVVAPATTGSNLIADSMTLQTSIGDVRSAPAAVNTAAYPTDFAKAKYWGIFVPTIAGSLAPTQAGTIATQNSLPDTTGGNPPGGTNLYFYGDPNLTRNDGGTLDTQTGLTARKRLIRQLVYFGRQDPTFSSGDTVDDNAPAPTATTSGFSTGGFSQPGNDPTSTATNLEYRIASPVTAGAGPTATWTFIAPNGGDYYATVHLPQIPPTPPNPTQKRITDAPYTVSVNGIPLTTQPIGQPVGVFRISQVQTGDVTLPTGAIRLNKGDRVTVTLTAQTGLTNPTGYTVVADSVRIATGGTGAIYCVDGFTGAVVWRFQTPGGLNGPGAPVFSSPLVTKINVLVTPAGPGGTPAAVYANKLVVIVGDDNGMVYCLDAVGNGDGTSNSNAIDPNSGLPIYIPQPAYGAAPPVQVDAPGYTPHIGTTGAYWIYRPDPNQPKYVYKETASAVIGTVRLDASKNPILEPNSDLPVPAAFSTASPNIFIDPSVTTTADPTTGSIPLNPDGSAPSNAKIYIGNSNGVLYALDGVGVSIDGTSKATYASTGDRFNASYDLRVDPTVFPAVAPDGVIPTPQPLWWFTLRGADPDSTTNTSSADIESAPAIHTTLTAGTYTPTVYIGSAHEMEATSNIGRVYALDGLLGPSGSNGTSFPAGQPNPAAPNYTGPGSFNYNIGQRPQTSATDTFDWSFPDAYNTVKGGRNTSSNKLPRPALGNITGSPVVFTDTPHEALTSTVRTRIYFAANAGLEVPYTASQGTVAAARPDETETGRIWAVNLDGTGVPVGANTVWSYPLANDPNSAALDRTPEPGPPIGAFLRATPAMGFVQFPSTITVSNGAGPYTHGDSVVGDVKSASIPMLYVATRGVNDTALYAIDIHGANDDQSLIYRQLSPDGSIFQSSPALVTNTSVIYGTGSNSGGNGGSVYVVGGNTLYDFGATPTSSPGIIDPATGTYATFPLIRENKAYTGFGPISSPAIAAAETTDLLTAAQLTTFGTSKPSSGFQRTMTDWIYVGDSGTGFCRGITPYDTTDNGIPPALNTLVPPTADSPFAVDLQAIMQVYLVNAGADSGLTSAAVPPALRVGTGAPLPVYDWGQSVYIRFKNIVPPADASGKPVYVTDSNAAAPSANAPVVVYAMGGPIEFDLSDTTIDTPTTATGAAAAAATLTSADRGTVPNVLLTAGSTPLANGFYVRSDTPPAGGNVNLVNPITSKGYIGAYTYPISDGTARRNTPGARRHISNARQTAQVFSYDGMNYRPMGSTVITVQTTSGNAVSKPITDGNGTVTGYAPTLTPVQPVDEPVFGILNPLAVRAGGIPLPLTGATKPYALPIADELGPFRAVISPLIAGNDKFDLEALSNGNDVLITPPDSTSGGGIDPTKRNLALTNPATSPHVVVTSTGLIPHNSSGDNFDVTGQSFSPMGTNTSGDGLSMEYFGRIDAPFAMDIADRSALGERLNRLRVKTGTVSGGGAGLYWNDNSPYNSALPNAIATPGHDHDSVVNYLPWETPPPAGRYENGNINSSIDYPNIGTSDVSATLYPYLGGSADLTLGNAVAKPVTLNGAEPGGRVVYTNPVQFHVSIPHYQPANQQLYTTSGQANTPGYSNYNSLGEIQPDSLTTGANNTFPMGYVTTRRIYIPDQTGFYRPGAAYRDVRVYTGVPPDYSTQMGDSTVEVGSVPSGFGIQTSQFNPLTTAYPTTPANAPGTFDPYRTFSPFNPMFQDYFKPVKVYNVGNVNLLNVHMDQKQNLPSGPSVLSLVSDALDSTSAIPGYDPLAALTGPRFGSFGANNVLEQAYLIRSSLDSDLVSGFGHNPAILNGTNAVGTPLIQVYPGATFHKAQVGSGQPTTLFVPDSPEGYTPGATLDVPLTNHPTQEADANNLDANGRSLPFKTAPFVGVAVPFGMPVGSYHASLQLFEGLDPDGYPQAVKNSTGVAAGSYTGLTAQIYPPRYGGAVGGIGAPTNGSNLPLDTIKIVNATNAAGVTSPVSLMPGSSNVAVLNVKVIENRMTDGNTFGTVSQVDQGSAIPATKSALAQSVPDFAPAAYRDKNTGNLSLYWTSGRGAGTNANAQFNIYQALVPMVKDMNGNFSFLPVNPAATNTYVPQWWTSRGNEATGYNANGTLIPALAANAGTNSGLTIAQDSLNLSNIAAFAVNVQSPPLTTAYQNTLLYYPVTANSGALGSAVPITNDPTQVKYGVKGLFTNTAQTNFARGLWAFWTATTRGRTAIYYNSADPASTSGNPWVPAAGPFTQGLLPIPAGLTAVADPAPMLMYGNVLVNGVTTSPTLIEVTYSGTAPDGNVDLYQSRYQPDAAKASLLDLVPFPAVTEMLTRTGQVGGWYQARDVAWSRTSQFNMFVNGFPILYDTANGNKPQFSKAVFDKASGLLVLTGVLNPIISTSPITVYAFGTTNASVTIYVDLATGRARFSATPNSTPAAFFSPLARRITNDSRADTGPITFLDRTLKPAPSGSVTADRRWYVWRKSGTGASSPATIYYKTQRLTAFLGYPIDFTKPYSITINGVSYTPAVDGYNVPAVVDANGVGHAASGRLFFPIQSGVQTGVEGLPYSVSYTDTNGNGRTWPVAPATDTIQWQDEARANDVAPPANAIEGLASVSPGYAVPLDTVVNENNVAAFLDPFAGLNTEHKVWLFWNSTRNGTADVYYETINPRFGP